MVSPGEFYKWLRVFKVLFGSASGGITIIAGSGLTGGGFIPLGGSGTISLAGGGGSFVEVTGTSQAMSVNSSYAANNAARVTLTLPTTSALGDTIYVYGKGNGGWKVAQNASQQIILGESATTVGTGGFVQSTYKNDILKLTCITANTTWIGAAESGNQLVN